MTKARAELTAAERKAAPLFRGLFQYFPDALMEVAHTSYVGNEQHNPGQPLHWAKEKSTDEGDALLRHQLDAGTFDTDGVRHSAKVAWRALAQLQREIEAEQRENPYMDATPETREYKARVDCQRTGGEWRNGNCYTRVVADQGHELEGVVQQGDFGALAFNGTPFNARVRGHEDNGNGDWYTSDGMRGDR